MLRSPDKLLFLGEKWSKQSCYDQSIALSSEQDPGWIQGLDLKMWLISPCGVLPTCHLNQQCFHSFTLGAKLTLNCEVQYVHHDDDSFFFSDAKHQGTDALIRIKGLCPDSLCLPSVWCVLYLYPYQGSPLGHSCPWCSTYPAQVYFRG